MSEGSNIPTIAVIPDDGAINFSGDEDEIKFNIEDVKTDIEDLLESDEEHLIERQKKRIKHKRNIKNPENTDSEEMVASDDDHNEFIIQQHSNPISLEEVFENMAQENEESFDTEHHSNPKKSKLRSQQSVIVKDTLNFNLLDNELGSGFTDTEDMVMSDDEDETINYPEIDLKDMNEQALIVESSNQNCIEPKKQVRRMRKTKFHTKKVNQTFLTPRSMSPQLSDVTDTEIVHSDSDNDDFDLKNTYHWKRTGKDKHSTDEEIAFISDKESKTASSQLQLPETNIENLTDVEEYSEDENFKEQNNNDYDENKMIECMNAVTSECGKVNEIQKPKITKQLNISKQLLKVPSNSNEDLTDIENCESEDLLIQGELTTPAIEEPLEPISIKFVQLIRKHDKSIKKMIKQIPNEDGEYPTDEEEVQSSDDENDAREIGPMPLAIIDTNSDGTDTEIVEDYAEDNENITTPPVSPISLPSPTRELIHIKIGKNGQPNTFIEILPTDYEYGLNQIKDENVTDTDTMSDIEIADDNEINYITPEIPAELIELDQGQMEHAERVSSPIMTVHNSNFMCVLQTKYEPTTDSELVIVDKESESKKRKLKKSRHMYINVNDMSDGEDITVQDYDNNPSRKSKSLPTNRRGSLPEIKTDSEDVSDDENTNQKLSPTSRALSITPDMIRNMNNEITMQQESLKQCVNQQKTLTTLKMPKKVWSPDNQRTDTEDVFTSADEELNADNSVQSISHDNSNLNEIKNEFDSHVHIKFTGKFDETEEILHIKGGGSFLLNNPTDTEEFGFSDDDKSNNMNIKEEWSPASAAELEGRYAASTVKDSTGDIGAIAKSVPEEGAEQDPTSSTIETASQDDEEETDEAKADIQSTPIRPRPAGSQHELSDEMKALLTEMEEQSKR